MLSKTDARIAIIMPAFNAGRYIADTIRSILQQCFTDWELWVIDDGSTDETANIVARFPDTRIHYYLSEHQGKPGCLRNLGARLASAELLFFFDADDMLHPDALRRLVSTMDDEPDSRMVYGFYTVIDTEGRQQPFAGIRLIPANDCLKRWSLPSGYQHGWKQIALAKLCVTTVFMIQRSFFESVGGFDERFYSSEDLHFFYKAFMKDRNAIKPVPFYVFQYRKSLKSITRNPAKFQHLLESQLEATRSFFNDSACPAEARVFEKEAYMRRYSYVSGLCLEQGCRVEALKYMLCALFSEKFSPVAWMAHCGNMTLRSLLPTSLDRQLKNLTVNLRDGVYFSQFSLRPRRSAPSAS